MQEHTLCMKQLHLFIKNHQDNVNLIFYYRCHPSFLASSLSSFPPFFIHLFLPPSFPPFLKSHKASISLQASRGFSLHTGELIQPERWALPQLHQEVKHPPWGSPGHRTSQPANTQALV